MAETKRVLVVGGGVAALATAVALVEYNRKQESRSSGGVRFDVTVMTSDDIWGGRASSWAGGQIRHRYERDAVSQGPAPRRPPRYALKETDFRNWPPDVPLNHGFHAVFDESTYVNFWHTLEAAGLTRDRLKSERLVSNAYEILVRESETAQVCRLQIHPPDRYIYPFNTHLTEAGWEVFRRGGWSLLDIASFGLKVVRHVWSYRDFDQLNELDQFQRISFEKWCRDKGVRPGVFNKMMFRFLFQGTYIAPNTMDAASALMGLWVILRHMDAAQWHYINGGITALLMDPVAAFLQAHGVRLVPRRELRRLVVDEAFSRVVGHEDWETPTHALQKPGQSSGNGFDYYVLTLPLDSLVSVLEESRPVQPPQPADLTLLDGFPDIKMLTNDEHFVQPAGTVNLQAWFRDPGLLADRASPTGDYRNVISGLEPLCVLVDYKDILPLYRDDPRFTGSVLEINGSLQELQKPEHFGYFECDSRFGEPADDKTIDFARAIMLDMATRYGFGKLADAVRNNAFLELPDWPGRTRWKDQGTKVPPFLWKNTDPFNRFFVTGPGTLDYRPWIWRRAYPDRHLVLRRPDYPPETKGYPDNLFLAGDWTRNGFDIPCMEGAARSGRMAALAVLKSAIGEDATADPTAVKVPADASLIEVFDPV